jgi:hypothetical protein
MGRPDGLVPTRQIFEHAGLWLNLPAWDMNDPAGRCASISSEIGELGNSESSLFVNLKLVQPYMAYTRSSMIWVVQGERQRLSGHGSNAGYKQYRQVFLLNGKRIEKLFDS